MANKSEKVSNLKKELQRILNLDQSRIIKHPEWGTVRFEEIQSNIERTYRLAQQLINLPLERLLEKTIDNINALTRQVAVSFEQLDQFSLGIFGNSDKSYHLRSIQQSTNPFFLRHQLRGRLIWLANAAT